MFSRPKILFLVSLLFVALLNPKFNPYLLFKFLIFYHSSFIIWNNVAGYDVTIQCNNYFVINLWLTATLTVFNLYIVPGF